VSKYQYRFRGSTRRIIRGGWEGEASRVKIERKRSCQTTIDSFKLYRERVEKKTKF